MSQVLINQYLAQLDVLKKVGGTHRESVVREAFKDLLKGWGKQHDLVFIPEYKLDSATKDTRFVDGALLYELRVPFGYWEAKDAKDDLDAVIAFKLKRGYPQDNIIFEDSTQAVLIQHRAEVMRCDVTDVRALEKLLKLFFSFERAEIADFRKAVEQFKADLPAVLQALREMIETQHVANAAFRKASAKFLKHAQEAINPSLSEADVREMLIQHILTEEIFSKVFDSEFHRDNNVARELYKLEGTFFTGGLKTATLKGLEAYYSAIRAAAAQIGSHHEKQTFLKVIYENFYKVYNAKAADRLGVVYTPNEIVRFMIEGADWLTEKHFGRNLIDKNVEILDPATGTGTFICELLEHFRGQPAKLKYKYREELHANEVAILPYYVANLNIEATYAAITGEYAEFQNLCFVDTLDNVGLHTATSGSQHDLFGGVSEENVARIKRQNAKKISVIIGNPPYNANQANENDNNKNREYPAVDKRIKDTYIHESTAQKTKLYDMYARFFRWASDRLDANGVLALVTNRSFIDKNTYDGFRRVVAREFDDIYVLDLGGNLVDEPTESKANVFGITVGVAISFCIRHQKRRAAASICYARLRHPTAEDRLEYLSTISLSQIEWELVKPNAAATWINQGSAEFANQIPLVSDGGRSATSRSTAGTIFKLFGLGSSSNRDGWLVDQTAEAVAAKVQFFLKTYDKCVRTQAFDTAIKWSETLKRRAAARRTEPFMAGSIDKLEYRPYCAQSFYFSELLVDRPGVSGQFFGPRGLPNPAIVFTDPGSQRPFMALAVNRAFDLHIVGSAAGANSVALQVIGGDGESADNITDWALAQFEKHYQSSVTPAKAGVQRRSKRLDSRPPIKAFEGRLRGNDESGAITKEAIFHYVYAVLHDPLYREKYAQNLKREFPRIPFYADFRQWAGWGAELMALHIGYESVEPFPLKRTDVPDERVRAAGQPPKPSLNADKEAGRIVIDSETTLAGIPPSAWDYRLGNRSALEWILDQYKEKKPKDATIREKFDTYRFADYKEKVIYLLLRVTRVSVETQRIVEAMRSATR